MPRIYLQARWIAPVTGPPFENGTVIIENHRILEVRKTSAVTKSATDFGDAVIIPGFVNTHTHLMLTSCHGRVPFAGSFIDWIKTLMALNPGGQGNEAMQSTIRQGLAQSLADGVTTLADIGGPPALEVWSHAAANVAGFVEVVGITDTHRERLAETRSVKAAVALIDQLEAPSHIDAPHHVGLSPHAPYSANERVYLDAIAYCQRTHRPLCTHLAETREELPFLTDGTGPFREFLDALGLWDGTFTPPGCSPVQYAAQLGLLDCGALLAHVNYVTDADLDVLARHNSHVAFCPRSHRFFEHEPHRWRDMLARGINVCIGTDSLASNASLSVLDELRFLHTQDHEIAGDQLLVMGTLAGARALHLDTHLGSLAPGQRADLAILPLTNANTTDPIEDIFRSTASPIAVFVGGTRVA